MKLIFILAALSAFAQENDWLIVPGQRIGPITANTSRADLDRMFGKANLRDQSVDYGEGDIRPGTIVYPDKPTAMLTIFWPSERINNRMVQDRTRVGSVDICSASLYEAPSCKWHTEEGVSLGTTLQTLETLNGRAFQMTAWGSDVGGNIVSWRGGRLAGYRDEKGKGGPTGLWLHLDFPTAPKGSTREQRLLFDSIKQEKAMMMSSDPSVRALRPIVTNMQLGFPRAN